jgi:hypothetical protein
MFGFCKNDGIPGMDVIGVCGKGARSPPAKSYRLGVIGLLTVGAGAGAGPVVGAGAVVPEVGRPGMPGWVNGERGTAGIQFVAGAVGTLHGVAGVVGCTTGL